MLIERRRAGFFPTGAILALVTGEQVDATLSKDSPHRRGLPQHNVFVVLEQNRRMAAEATLENCDAGGERCVADLETMLVGRSEPRPAHEMAAVMQRRRWARTVSEAAPGSRPGGARGRQACT